MESAERLPGLDRRGLRKRASARKRKRHWHLLLTQHLPNFGTESEIGVETMSGERSSWGKGLARPNFSWEEFELAQRPTKSLLTPGTRHYDNLTKKINMIYYAVCVEPRGATCGKKLMCESAWWLAHGLARGSDMLGWTQKKGNLAHVSSIYEVCSYSITHNECLCAYLYQWKWNSLPVDLSFYNFYT